MGPLKVVHVMMSAVLMGPLNVVAIRYLNKAKKLLLAFDISEAMMLLNMPLAPFLSGIDAETVLTLEPLRDRERFISPGRKCSQTSPV